MDRYRRDHYELKLSPKKVVRKKNGRYIWTDEMEKTLIAWASDSTQKEIAEFMNIGIGTIRRKMKELGLSKQKKL